MCSCRPSFVTNVSGQIRQPNPRGEDDEGDSLELLLSGDDVALCYKKHKNSYYALLGRPSASLAPL